MKRTQPQFESEHERERRMLIEDFRSCILWIFFWLLIFFGSLFLIGYVDAKGEEIDAKINNHINHLIR